MSCPCVLIKQREHIDTIDCIRHLVVQFEGRAGDKATLDSDAVTDILLAVLCTGKLTYIHFDVTRGCIIELLFL